MTSHEIASADALLTEVARLNAHLAVLRAALEDRHSCEQCGGEGKYWVSVGDESELEVCDCYIRADHVLYHEDHPGAQLAAELGAARALAAYLNDRRHWNLGTICPTCGFGTKLDGSEFHGTGCPLDAYNQAQKANSDE